MPAGEWRSVVDKNTGVPYYYNKRTKETTWIMPEEMKREQEEATKAAQTHPTEKPVPAKPEVPAFKPPEIIESPMGRDASTSLDFGDGGDIDAMAVSGNCSVCSKAIYGPALTVLGKKYHGQCLVCEVGGHTLAPSFEYTEYQGKMYCVEHAAVPFQKDCSVCHKKIPGQYVTIGKGNEERFLHPDCWTCTHCGEVLTPETGKSVKGEFVCKACAEKQLLSMAQEGDADAKAAAAYQRLQDKLAAMKIKKARGEGEVQSERKLQPGQKFTLAELQEGRDADGELPVDMDKGQKENYLNDEEFAKHFKMSRQEFASTPKWKRDKIKKDLKIF